MRPDRRPMTHLLRVARALGIAALTLGTSACIQCDEGFAEFDGECIPEVVTVGRRPPSPPPIFIPPPPPPSIPFPLGGGGGTIVGPPPPPPPPPVTPTQPPETPRDRLERERRECYQRSGGDLVEKCMCSATFLDGNCQVSLDVTRDLEEFENCRRENRTFLSNCLNRVQRSDTGGQRLLR